MLSKIAVSSKPTPKREHYATRYKRQIAELQRFQTHGDDASLTRPSLRNQMAHPHGGMPDPDDT